MAGTLLSSRNTRTNKQETLRLELPSPADRVGIVRVTAINDDITLLEMGNELLNKGVNSITSLYEEDNFAWFFQLCNELLNRVSTLDVGALKEKGMSAGLRVGNKFKGND